MKYILKNKYEDKYIEYLKKRYGINRANSFIKKKDFLNN
jgi:hypothetical protein